MQSHTILDQFCVCIHVFNHFAAVFVPRFEQGLVPHHEHCSGDNQKTRNTSKGFVSDTTLEENRVFLVLLPLWGEGGVVSHNVRLKSTEDNSIKERREKFSQSLHCVLDGRQHSFPLQVSCPVAFSQMGK